MNNTNTNIHKAQVALLMTIVFMSSLLIQPTHSWLAHHTAPHAPCVLDGKLSITNQTDTHCPICNYEFCLFIPQKKPAALRSTVIAFKQLTARTVTLLTLNSHPLFHLRAPPVF